MNTWGPALRPNVPNLLRHIARMGVLLAIILSVAACSRSFGYRFADTYIMWQVRGYVSLDRSQRSDMRSEVNQLLQWHAENEMPVYVSLLQTLIDDIEGQRFDQHRYAYYQSQVDERWRVVREQLLTPAVQLLPRLSDHQVEQLLCNLHERIDEREAKFLEQGVEERRDDGADTFTQQIERWLGYASEEQLQIVEQWAEQMPDMTTLWIEYRRQWADYFAAALAKRDQPDAFASAMQPLVLTPEQWRSDALLEAVATTDEIGRESLLALATSLSSEQRAHLITQLQGLQRDISRMARTRDVTIEYQ